MAEAGEDPDLVGVGKAERKAFLRVLSSLAWADGEASQSELEVVHLAASDLQVSISERDLEPPRPRGARRRDQAPPRSRSGSSSR